jgi:glycosyltransferase involved in cell wall biosynthesis
VRHVDVFLAVSEYCARFMTSYLGIPADQMSVVPLGIPMAGYERRQPSAGPFTVGYFARVAPEKGLRELAEAYVRLRRMTTAAPMRFEAAGYMAPNHAGYLADVRRTLDQAGLAGEFTYRGELDRAGKLAFLRGLDVLSVPATYDEPKGMFLLEAMAAGVPVVQPRRGAFVEVIEKTRGGLLVEPNAPDALAAGLHQLFADRDLAARLSRQAFDGVRVHYSIERSADRLLQVYDAVTRGVAPQPC